MAGREYAMKGMVIAIIASLSLCGCVAQRMDEGLRALLGQDIHEAVRRLGYPDAQRKMSGDTIYVWGTSRDEVLPMSTTSTTSGMVGSAPVYGTTTSTELVPANFNCKIELAVDSNSIIKNFRYTGNAGGCAAYARALKPQN
jgi:hypothetical protein